VLKAEVGDILKLGIVDVGMTNLGSLVNKRDDSLTLSLGGRKNFSLTPTLNIDLILAVPRPLRLERLLPVVSTLGINRLILISASKVEKDYFGNFNFVGSSSEYLNTKSS